MWKWLKRWLFFWRKPTFGSATPRATGERRDDLPIFAGWPKEPGVYLATAQANDWRECGVAYIVFVSGERDVRFRVVDAVDGKEQGHILTSLAFKKVLKVNRRRTAMVVVDDWHPGAAYACAQQEAKQVPERPLRTLLGQAPPLR